MSKKLSLLQNIICPKCKGKGSKSGASVKCAGCKGSGMKVTVIQLGSYMVQQMQHQCNVCNATGETIDDKDHCLQWKGEKVVVEKKVLEVHVEKGMQNGQKITFLGEADEAPDTIILCFKLEFKRIIKGIKEYEKCRTQSTTIYDDVVSST